MREFFRRLDPRRSDPAPVRIVLWGKADCSLCEKAGAILARVSRDYPLTIDKGDVTSARAAINVRQKAGKSAGWRDVTRRPSRTTSRSTQFAPALIRSSLIAGTEVTVRPLTMRAEQRTQPAWQIAPTTFP